MVFWCFGALMSVLEHRRGRLMAKGCSPILTAFVRKDKAGLEHRKESTITWTLSRLHKI